MARPKATQSQKDAVRSKIRQAAAELYLEQGVANLTARAIAERAGVSPGTIYVHFGNLAGLARSLWQGPVEKFEQELQKLAEQEQDPLERVRSFLSAYLQFARDNPDLYRGTFLFVRPPSEGTPEKQDFGVNTFARLLVDALEEGQRQGWLLVKDARTQAHLIWSTLHGSVALPINLDRFEWQACSDEDVIEGLLMMLRR